MAWGVIGLLPLPACGERPTRKARRVRGPLHESERVDRPPARKGPVARIERSEIRERPVNTAKPPRVSLALNPGYGPELVDRLSLPASGEREKKSPPC